VEKKTDVIKELKAPSPVVAPLHANISVVIHWDESVLLDFGYVAPSYVAPNDLEDTHIARILIPLESAKILIRQLKETVSDCEQTTQSKEVKMKKVTNKGK
jgi:hypothetical protein